MFSELNSDNARLYAMANYRNPLCESVEEFDQDLARFSSIRKLMFRYFYRDDLNLRLALNHVITIYNVFEIKAATRILFYTMNDEYKPSIKSFLLYLGYIRKEDFPHINTDPTIDRKLKEI